MSSAIGAPIKVKHTYQALQSGAAIWLTDDQARTLLKHPDVKSIQRDQTFELSTDAGPTYINAHTVWDGSQTAGLPASKGEGVVVGVIDTGVAFGHDSFSDTPADGHTFTNPLGSGNFIGWCDPGHPNFDPSFTCNDKLIGAWDFADPDGESDGPADGNGHGSHTASTAAGNTLTGPFAVTGGGGTFDVAEISGVAPHANLITYDVCVGNCSGAAITGAINQAFLDGVDVINYSISGGNTPWGDADRMFLELIGNGAVVSASAGNTSATVPDPVGNVAHRGPWMMTVANEHHGRLFVNTVSTAGLGDMPGQLGSVDNFGGSDVVAEAAHAEDVEPANFEGCNPFTGTPFTGKIAIIERGTCNFTDKINNAEAAGAVAAIIFNHETGGNALVNMNLDGAPTNIPALGMTRDDGLDLAAEVTGTPATLVTMGHEAAVTHSSAVRGTLSGGSLIGPNESFDVTKPDIAGPGTQVFAAVNGPPSQFAFLSGTSMSSPHLAGSAALLKSLYPDWTPSQVKSALMLTATQDSKKPNGVDPADADDVGSGTASVGSAAETGLHMHQSYNGFILADPSQGGEPRELNLPSMRHSNCDGQCSFQRTVCSAIPEGGPTPSVEWFVQGAVGAGGPVGYQVNVMPADFELLNGDVLFTTSLSNDPTTSSCQTLNISVEITDQALVNAGELIFDEVILTTANPARGGGGEELEARMTVTVLPTGVVPE